MSRTYKEGVTQGLLRARHMVSELLSDPFCPVEWREQFGPLRTVWWCLFGEIEKARLFEGDEPGGDGD